MSGTVTQLTRLSQVLFVVTLALLFSPVGQTPHGLAEEGAEDSEDGIDLFLKAVISEQTDSRISSGAISYEVKVNRYKTEEEIQEEIDALIDDFKKNNADHPMLDRMIKNASESVRSSYPKTNNGLFRFDYSKKDCMLVELQLVYQDFPKNIPGNAMRSITKCFLDSSSRKIEAAQIFPGSRDAFVRDMGSVLSLTATQFEQFGRPRGLLAVQVASLVKAKGELATKEEVKQLFKKMNGNIELKSGDKEISILNIVETKPFEDGSTAYTLETTVAGKVTHRFVIVPSMGYVCPKIEFYDFTSGNLTEVYEAKDFVKLPRSGVYYPLYYAKSIYKTTDGQLREKYEYTIHQETLSLNEPMNPSDFTLEIDEGAEVYDKRGGKMVSYVADRAGTLSLGSGGLDLDKMSWLREKTDELPKSDVSEPRPSQIPRIILMVIGFALTGWGVIVRKRKKKNGTAL